MFIIIHNLLAVTRPDVATLVKWGWRGQWCQGCFSHKFREFDISDTSQPFFFLFLYTTRWGVRVLQMPQRKLRNDKHEFRGLKDQPWREIKIPMHQGQIIQISYKQDPLTSKRRCGWSQVNQSQPMVAGNIRYSRNGNGKPKMLGWNRTAELLLTIPPVLSVCETTNHWLGKQN